jgi:hypothetical protein
VSCAALVVAVIDSHFTEIPLPNGGFRGFDAHSETYAIDGRYPWDMGGPAHTVLSPGKPGTYDSCGQWLNRAEPVGNTIIGFIHSETACHYQANLQTHMSTSLSVSTDYGLTWQSYGQILTGTDSPTANKQLGRVLAVQSTDRTATIMPTASGTGMERSSLHEDLSPIFYLAGG